MQTWTGKRYRPGAWGLRVFAQRQRRAQCCEPPQASIPIRHRSRIAKCSRNSARRSCLSNASPVSATIALQVAQAIPGATREPAHLPLPARTNQGQPVRATARARRVRRPVRRSPRPTRGARRARADANDPRLADYQPYWAARADLPCSRAGATADSLRMYDLAIGIERDPAARRFLQHRRIALTPTHQPPTTIV
ncbi:hypothetical protein Bcen2424_0169 [Burkholderia cenocepacia HI2424]|nr:hypothetical protein Bcen2424_0169 [Burkholderia cenocepacia HI2424]